MKKILTINLSEIFITCHCETSMDSWPEEIQYSNGIRLIDSNRFQLICFEGRRKHKVENSTENLWKIENEIKCEKK